MENAKALLPCVRIDFDSVIRDSFLKNWLTLLSSYYDSIRQCLASWLWASCKRFWLEQYVLHLFHVETSKLTWIRNAQQAYTWKGIFVPCTLSSKTCYWKFALSLKNPRRHRKKEIVWNFVNKFVVFDEPTRSFDLAWSRMLIVEKLW